MSLLLMLAPALAANFTASTAKWDTANVYCAAYSGTGGIARTDLESGAEPSLTLVNPLTMETVPMGSHEGWDTAFGVVHPDDAPGVVAGPYAFELSPMDRNNDKGLPSSQLAIELHTLAVGPKMHVDPQGQLIGAWKWDAEAKIEKQLPHVQQALPDASAWVQFARQAWAPSAVEAALKEQWATFGGAWLGKPVDGPSWETRESPVAGIDMVRTWSNAASKGCGDGVKSCVALTVESRLVDPAAATATFATTLQTTIPAEIQFHAWSRQVTNVNPKTMQVYAWSQVGFQGQRDTSTDRLEGAANSVSCRPR